MKTAIIFYSFVVEICVLSRLQAYRYFLFWQTELLAFLLFDCGAPLSKVARMLMGLVSHIFLLKIIKIFIFRISQANHAGNSRKFARSGERFDPGLCRRLQKDDALGFVPER